jgi:uncharacterized Zn finger protein
MSKKSISKMLFSNQERVELALVDDIETLYKDVIKQDDKIESLAKELRSVSIKTAVKIEQMRKMRTQVEARAKELGIDPDTIIPTAMFSRTNNIMKKIDLIKKLRGV